MNGDDEAVRNALSIELARLEDGAAFTVIEFGANGFVVWHVCRDENGTPQATMSALPASSVADPQAFYHEQLGPLLEDAGPLVVCGSLSEPPADVLDLLRTAHGAPVYACGTPAETLLREAIREAPLTRWYELVVLRQEPTGHPEAGRLRLHSRQLFPPGARLGHSSDPFRISCAPTDDRGTVFAVVTREGRRFRPISVQSAMLKPGDYELNAVLTRPGRVKLEGLPAELRAEQRPWSEIVRTVPDRLVSPQPVHLVCAIEVSGGKQHLQRRIDRLEELIASADAGGQWLAVSLVSYGPHSVERFVREEPAAVLAWATTSERALSALRGLAERTPAEGEYLRAAQLECALATVASRLSDRDGRPVLVTVGARPPHPPRVDIRTEIIPCPDRTDWHGPLYRLRGVRGITFGALCDQDACGEIWRELGQNALAALEVVDMDCFAVSLGLREPVQAVAFPLIDQGGT